MKMVIKPNQIKKIFELLKNGYEINMQTIKDPNEKETHIIFYNKLDKHGNKIYEEENLETTEK